MQNETEIIRLERAVVEAAVAWKRGFGSEGNQAQWIAFSQAVDSLITTREQHEQTDNQVPDLQRQG